MGKKPASQAKLKKDVLEQSLCTGCGACVGLCPYQVIHKDRTVQLFDCDLTDGKCYAFCPRTPADLNAIRKSLYASADLTTEIGAVKSFVLTRAADPELQKHAQHGGTVTALLELAMAEGWVDAAIVSAQNEALEQEGKLIEKRADLRQYSKSRFTVSPTVAAFHRQPADAAKKLAVVATPCQAQALAKIKTTQSEGYEKASALQLVIGLFCGWTLSMERFCQLLQKHQLSLKALAGVDIPAGKNILELQTAKGTTDVPLAEVDACIRTACRYCVDSTAEFADLSVGAARFGGTCEEMLGWNQVIIRSSKGAALIQLAREKGVLEVREAPAQALQELKRAAVEKKKKALKHIVEKSGSAKNLLYLQSDDTVVKAYSSKAKKK